MCSRKVLDTHGRWRSKTIAFRISPEDNTLLNQYVALSGQTKQDYIMSRLMGTEIVVQGNPRVYKALRNQLAAVLEQLQRIEAGTALDDELLATIRQITVTMRGMKGESTE